MNNNIFKNVFIIIIIIALLFSFNSYVNSSESIDNLSYVMAIGVDFGETAKYKISMQLSTIESSATEAAIKPNTDSSKGGGGGSGGGSGRW